MHLGVKPFANQKQTLSEKMMYFLPRQSFKKN